MERSEVTAEVAEEIPMETIHTYTEEDAETFVERIKAIAMEQFVIEKETGCVSIFCERVRRGINPWFRRVNEEGVL